MTIYRLLLLFFLSIPIENLAKDQLFKDLDNDAILDEIILDKKNAQLICRLSTQNFIAIRSKKLEDLSDTSGIESAKNGFKLYNHVMRSGYYCQFRYNPTERKIQLIGMSRYHLGDGMQNGSGESSVNLITNKYIGEWIRFDSNSKKHVKIPAIQKPFSSGKAYLEEFSTKQPDAFIDFCDNLRNAAIYNVN